MLALTTSRSLRISPFLGIFSTIFAVEYVVTGLAYVPAQTGPWPASLSEAMPPASLPTTVAIFGLLVHLISFIPVISQITRLTDPYFATDDRRDLEIAGFGARSVIERRFASLLIMALVVINQLQVGINIRLSFFNRDWFNAIRVLVAVVRGILLLGGDCGRQQPGRVLHRITATRICKPPSRWFSSACSVADTTVSAMSYSRNPNPDRRLVASRLLLLALHFSAVCANLG